MAKQYSVTYDSYDKWKLPINLAIGFHILIAASMLFLPDLLKSRPKHEDIYTVNLINFSEPAPVPPAQTPVTEQEVETPPEPAKSKNAVPLVEPVKPALPKEVKAVSIKPLKRKIKKKILKQPDQTLNRKKEFEKNKREKIAEAIKAEQHAAEQARLAAEEAARQQKLMEQQLARVKSQVRFSSTVPPQRKSGGTKSTIEAQYTNAIMNHISNYWSLPTIKSWDPSLLAVPIIVISKNGTIVNQFFEKRSGDATFDQFVRKALQDANPLPPIPAALRKNSFEVGVRFSPGSIQ